MQPLKVQRSASLPGLREFENLADQVAVDIFDSFDAAGVR